MYLWIKALHIVFIASWFAGLFYLPRLYVYHAERGASVEPSASFAIMEDKLLGVIMRPAAIVAWLAGLALVATPGIVDWSSVWPWTKAGAVLAMTVFHHWLMIERKKLTRGQGSSGRRYRLMNEVPTLLMVVIVLSVIVKF